MKAVILAAGAGSRLGKPQPKCLNQVGGQTILGRQLRILHGLGIKEIIVVVGFKKNLIMEHYPEPLYKYNPFFFQTNTSKSLLMALENLDDDVIWVNGDVVLDAQVIQDVASSEFNAAAVDQKRCGPEEVKYTADIHGNLTEISKQVTVPLGEAVGVNKIMQHDLSLFRACLRECKNEDYFEKGMELALRKDVVFKTIDISRYRCIEVDFEQDLYQAQEMFHAPPPRPLLRLPDYPNVTWTEKEDVKLLQDQSRSRKYSHTLNL